MMNAVQAKTARWVRAIQISYSKIGKTISAQNTSTYLILCRPILKISNSRDYPVNERSQGGSGFSIFRRKKKERINGIQKVRLAGTVKFGPPTVKNNWRHLTITTTRDATTMLVPPTLAIRRR